MFDPSSRYNAIETATLLHQGSSVQYKRRRLLPQPSELTTLFEHIVQEGDRIDHVALSGFGDSLQAHRLLDAEAALHPEDILLARRRVRIAMSRLSLP